MKKLIIPVLAAIALLGASCSTNTYTPTSTKVTVFIPEQTNYVVDNSGVLDDQMEVQFNNDIKAFDEKGKGQIAVLTVKTTSPLDIDQYGIRVGEKWKVGHAGKDDGVILIIATVDRKVRIEVGRGAEAVLTDAEAKNILDNKIIPKLRNNKWDDAVAQGIMAIEDQLK